MGLVLSSSSRTYVRERGGVNSASALASAGKAFGASPVTQAASKTRTRAAKAKVTGDKPGPGLLARLGTPEVLGTGAALGLAAVLVALVVGSLKPSPSAS